MFHSKASVTKRKHLTGKVKFKNQYNILKNHCLLSKQQVALTGRLKVTRLIKFIELSRDFLLKKAFKLVFFLPLFPHPFLLLAQAAKDKLI